MYNSIEKVCECGNNQNVELTDELVDELDMNGYVTLYCEECEEEIDVNSDDLENSKSDDEYGVYELNDWD